MDPPERVVWEVGVRLARSGRCSGAVRDLDTSSRTLTVVVRFCRNRWENLAERQDSDSDFADEGECEERTEVVGSVCCAEPIFGDEITSSFSWTDWLDYRSK